VEAGKSPGGNDENTGYASAFNERVTMGAVEVICTEPVKLFILESSEEFVGAFRFRQLAK
jgi:hypothetical protein